MDKIKPYWTKCFESLMLVSTVCIGLFFIYHMFVAIYPLNVLDMQTETMAVLNPEDIKRGEHVDLELQYCKNFPFPAESETKIENGVLWELPLVETNFNTGCRTEILEITIPFEVPAGEPVRIVRTMHYRVSLFTEVKEVVRSEFFVVKE